MKILLEKKGNVNYYFIPGNDDITARDYYSSRRYMATLTVLFDTCEVTDGSDSDEDKEILLDMFKRHPMEVHMEFSSTFKSKHLDRKLNLALTSTFFSEFEETFRTNFTITGEMRLPPQSDPWGEVCPKLVIVIAKGIQSFEDANKYIFQDAKSEKGNRFCDNFVRIMNEMAQPIVANLKLCIETHDAIDNDNPHADFRYKINRKILNDEIATDVTIIASNGAQIKCHKSFLVAHSPMIEGMFNSGLQEATTNVIKMTTVSELGVRALLAYLYYWNLKGASNNCDVAVELLKAADYYIIPPLDRDVRNLILKKPAKWFSLNGALDLFVFSYRLGRAQLQSAALQVVQMNFDELNSNASYQELLKNDPATATELYNAALSIKYSKRHQTANDYESEAGVNRYILRQRRPSIPSLISWLERKKSKQTP